MQKNLEYGVKGGSNCHYEYANRMGDTNSKQ